MKRCYDKAAGEFAIELPSKVTRSQSPESHQPSSVIDPQKATILDPTIVNLLYRISNCSDTQFVFFLGAQGKEFICDIKQKFPRFFDSIIFVSSNLENYHFRNVPVHLATSQECKQLSRYFQVTDPLGGGNYPLNYLFVVDPQHRVRVLIPVRIGNGHGGHEKFGINFNELDGLIEEYIKYFTLSMRVF